MLEVGGVRARLRKQRKLQSVHSGGLGRAERDDARRRGVGGAPEAGGRVSLMTEVSSGYTGPASPEGGRPLPRCVV